MNINYYPKNTGSNNYPIRMQDILKSVGSVSGYSIKDEINCIAKLDFKRKDILVLNWIENFIFNKKSGKISSIGVTKFLLFMIVAKVRFKKIIYVQHNIYPHGIVLRNRSLAKKIISFISEISDVSFVHSPVHPSGVYIPHPLYSFPLEYHESREEVNTDKYIIFGRIEPYKKLEKMADFFPKDKTLIIAGSVENNEYLRYLYNVFAEHKNIIFIPRFVEEYELTEIIKTCNAMILNHSDDDMIVSGSFFYALTKQKKVLTMSTPFLEWAENELGDEVIMNFKSLSDMALFIREDKIYYNAYSPSVVDKVNILFGDDTILNNFIDNIDNKLKL